jgi:hypothetical protein
MYHAPICNQSKYNAKNHTIRAHNEKEQNNNQNNSHHMLKTFTTKLMILIH